MKYSLAVLLPHYNNLDGLKLTLESLLREHEVFTLFLIDDGSNNLVEVEDLVRYFSEYFKIVFMRNETNLGIVKTLNRGLKHILSLNKYQLIARLDAGDVCLNNRFWHQKQLFLEDGTLGLVGSWVRFVDMGRNKLFDFKPPKYHGKLKRVIHVYNPFVHPSIMLKVAVIKSCGFYPDNFPALEDHAFFFDIIKKYKTANTKKILLEYELNPKSISSKNRMSQTKSRIRLFLREFDFSFVATYGLIRALLTFLMPSKSLILLKRYLFYR